MFKSKVDLCEICSLRVKANSVLRAQCDKWTNDRCSGEERVTPMYTRNFTCKKCEWNIGKAVKQEDKSCDEVETLT